MIAFEYKDCSSITALIKKSNLSCEVEKSNAAGKKEKSLKFLFFFNIYYFLYEKIALFQECAFAKLKAHCQSFCNLILLHAF